MIRLSAAARQQLRDLLGHYEMLGRTQASRSLVAAIDKAITQIKKDPTAGRPAPRPYPGLAHPDQRWVKAGRYWVAYSTGKPPIIVAIFYETANIPERL